jgi:hypothetical protein
MQPEPWVEAVAIFYMESRRDRMIVIIHYDAYQQRWTDISRITEHPGIIKLWRKKIVVKDVTVAIRLEIIP